MAQVGIKPSKTLAFNGLVAVIAYLTANVDSLQAMMTPEAYSYLILFIAVANGALRAVTTEPLIVTKETQE